MTQTIPICLHIKDTLLLRGITQLIAQLDEFSLSDDPETAMVLTDQGDKALIEKTKKIIRLDRMQHPISMREIFADLLKSLNRGKTYRIGADLFIAADKKIITQAGDEILLTGLEAALLEFFAAHAGISCPKEMLLKHVWHYQDNVTTHTVETHVYRLRQKYPALERFLNTTENGYMLQWDDDGDDDGNGTKIS